MPKVVIEEFVQVDADSSDEEEEKKTETTAPIVKQKKQLTKLRTHHEISDVSTLQIEFYGSVAFAVFPVI